MSKRIRSDRTQRAMERDGAFRATREAEAWLRSLTPEHRSVHERGLPCGECIGAGFRAAAATLDRISARLRERTAGQ